MALRVGERSSSVVQQYSLLAPQSLSAYAATHEADRYSMDKLCIALEIVDGLIVRSSLFSASRRTADALFLVLNRSYTAAESTTTT